MPLGSGRASSARLADTPWALNSHVSGAWLRGPQARLPVATTASIDRALERGGITMRGYDRVLRVNCTGQRQTFLCPGSRAH